MRIRKLILPAVVLVVLVSTWAAAEPVERNLDTTSDPRVSIKNKKGSLTIVGWDENRIRVTGTVGNDVTQVKVDDDQDRPEIEVVSTKWKSNQSEARLTVYVPRASSLDIETVSASIDVSGVSGDSIDIETTSGSVGIDGAFNETDIEGVSGSIRLTKAAGEVDITNVSGGVGVRGNLDRLDINVVSGSINAEVAARTVKVESVSGSIGLKADVADEVKGESVSGGINFSGTLSDGGDMEFHVLSGSVTVEFDDPAYGEYELTTFSGGINCRIEPLRDLQRNSKSMQFEYGDGDRSVELESFSGSISVR